MPVTPQEMFKKAVARGMAASPFATTTAVPLYLRRGSTRVALKGCTIDEDDNAAKAEEYGLDRKYTFKAHIPKTLLTTAPNRELDKLEYRGRIYDIDAVSGAAAHSPLWDVEASCPMKS
jgi:hypothetical protein